VPLLNALLFEGLRFLMGAAFAAIFDCFDCSKQK